jgi:hypothetical protein
LIKGDDFLITLIKPSLLPSPSPSPGKGEKMGKGMRKAKVKASPGWKRRVYFLDDGR